MRFENTGGGDAVINFLALESAVVAIDFIPEAGVGIEGGCAMVAKAQFERSEMSFELISVVPLSDGIFDAAALQFEVASVGGGEIIGGSAGGLRLQP